MNWAFDGSRNPAPPFVAAETLLSGGTKDLRPQDVLELFEDKNSCGHLSVRPDHAIGEVEFPKEYVDEVVDIVVEMLVRPQVTPEWLARVKDGMRANMEQARIQSSNAMWSATILAILGDQPLRSYLNLPDLDQIDAVTRENVLTWHKETLAQANLTIAVTGAISQADAGDVIDRILAQLPKSDATQLNPAPANCSPRSILVHRPEAQKTSLAIIGQLPSTAEGGDLIDLLALEVFGQAGSGPLFDAVRTELRASYGLQAGFSNYDRATRFMFITGEVETTQLTAAKDVAIAAYREFRTNPNFDALPNIQQATADGTTKNVRSVNVVARTLLELALGGQDTALAPNLGDAIAAFSPEDIAARLRNSFPAAEDLMVFAVSPDANALEGACVITQIEQALTCP